MNENTFYVGYGVKKVVIGGKTLEERSRLVSGQYRRHLGAYMKLVKTICYGSQWILEITMKKVTVFLSICLFVFFSSVVFAQENQEQKKSEPATKLEIFLAKKGTLIVKDFYNCGVVTGSFGAYISFDALFIYEPGKETEGIRGLRATVHEGVQLEKEETSFLDFEEVESLSDALQYIISLSIQWDREKKEYTEVIFSTKGNFQVGFYQEGISQHAFVNGGYIRTAKCFFSTDDFEIMKTIVNKVLEKLKTK